LIGIITDLAVASAMLGANRLPALTAIFLASTIATSVTGFMFHFAAFGPPEIVGVISLIALAMAIFALYVYRLAGSWRVIYVAAAMLSLYLNVFVGVVQTFQKVAFFHALAPTQTEAPFKMVQGVVLIAFIALGLAAARKFRPPASAVAYA
jgi:hypothetical protein